MQNPTLYAKFTIFFLALLSPVAGHAAATDAVKVLDAIRSVCKDAWCEDVAFGYDFQKVVLKPEVNETEVVFRLSQKDPVRLDSTEGASFRAQITTRGVYDVSCVLPGYSTYGSIVQGEKFLRAGVRAALTACIDSLKDQVVQATQPL